MAKKCRWWRCILTICTPIENWMTKWNLPVLGTHGGLSSIRLPCWAKPRLTFDHNEAIFRSSQLNESCWTVDREITLQTNGLGLYLLVSAFVSRAFGFGMKIVEEALANIKQFAIKQKYVDEETATYLNGNNTKRPLIYSPFVWYLNYG